MKSIVYPYPTMMMMYHIYIHHTHTHIQVMPRDYEEIVLYLGGKRTLDHFLDSDKEQAYD